MYTLNKYQRKEFMQIQSDDGSFYWSLKDQWNLPFLSVDEETLDNLPLPFNVYSLHPENPIGTETLEKDEFTNTVLLDSETFNRLSKNMKDNLRNIKAKNKDLIIIENNKEDINKASIWFREKWSDETDEIFTERISLWKNISNTLSLYDKDNNLLGVHISTKDDDTVYYLGCFWNPEFKNRSVATYLLYEDIKKALDKGLKFYELGIGDEPYKKRWGVIEKPTKSIDIETKEDITKYYRTRIIVSVR